MEGIANKVGLFVLLVLVSFRAPLPFQSLFLGDSIAGIIARCCNVWKNVQMQPNANR